MLYGLEGTKACRANERQITLSYDIHVGRTCDIFHYIAAEGEPHQTFDPCQGSSPSVSIILAKRQRGPMRISGQTSSIALGTGGGGTNLLRLGAGSQWIVAAKATLPRTMPRREFKSSAKDSAHRPFGTTFPGVRAGCLR